MSASPASIVPFSPPRSALPRFRLSRRTPSFSQTVFFGDSLTDSGFYQPILVDAAGRRRSIVARFTTNPGLVWAEFLADFYGTNARRPGS
jgi:phospholipase/lecithinase/hemolysin